MSKPVRMEPGVKLRDGDKMALILQPEDRTHQEHLAQEQAALGL